MHSTSASCGCMTAEWLSDQLADFMYELEDDLEGGFITRANELSNRYGKTSEDFVSELIAFVTNLKQTYVDRLVLDSFEQQVLLKDLRRGEGGSFDAYPAKIVHNERNENSWIEESKIPDAHFFNENITLSERYLLFTPVKKSQSDINYHARKNSGKIIIEFAGRNVIEKDNAVRRNIRKVSVENLCVQDSKNLVRFGAEKIVEQAEALLARVRCLCGIITDENEKLARTEQKDFIQTVLSGYVLNCSEEQFDTNNCSLQCIDESSAVVKLDLNNLEAYSLFPGKVVGMQGTFMGSLFVPDKIFEPKEPPLASFERQSGTDFLNVWCACGPFTSSTTLSYEQLYDFIELVNKEKPDVLILIGPFIDRTSSVVRSSKCCITYDELMETLLGKIDDALSGSDVQVLIIPNGKKDAALRPSFPTPAFRFLRHQKQLSKKSMIFLPDPAIVRIAGVEFAITASEIIQHLGKNEIGRLDGSENHDRMSRLVRDLFRQRSLYPLYPASDDITYKLRESVERASLLTIPHVIILPSMLTPTVKIVAGSVYVNINALVRGNNSTFMKLKIDFNEIDAKTDNSHTSIADFCEVKIVRL